MFSRRNRRIVSDFAAWSGTVTGGPSALRARLPAQALLELRVNTTPPIATLDAEELIFLALRAMEQDRDEYAIDCLKRALIVEPESGIAHHLLGAVYTQLGMIDRGLIEMTAAVKHAPALHIARFQLGLLYFTSGDIGAAQTVWEPLAELPEDHPLDLFRRGILHLARDEFEPCLALLARGLDRNTDYPSLNNDMTLLAGLTEQALAERDAPGTARPPTSEAANADGQDGRATEGARHVLLSGYQDTGACKKPN